MNKMGRKKIEDRGKIICAIPCNCHLSADDIEKLGGSSAVRRIFQDAGNKEVESLLFVKSKVQ